MLNLFRRKTKGKTVNSEWTITIEKTVNDFYGLACGNKKTKEVTVKSIKKPMVSKSITGGFFIETSSIDCTGFYDFDMIKFEVGDKSWDLKSITKGGSHVPNK